MGNVVEARGALVALQRGRDMTCEDLQVRLLRATGGRRVRGPAAQQLARRGRGRGHPLDRGRPPHIGTTAGIAEWDHCESADGLLARADRALLAAKASGRGRKPST
jgi:GGDEF domain-containing protein